jgi:acyl-CoA synthetase (AMP-forming)/AMP-acid ligase II
LAEAEFLGGRRVVRIDKVSSIGFVEALASVWRTGSVALPLDPDARSPDIGVTIAEHMRISPGGGWIRPVMPRCDPDAPALISFTSGTTGEPKAILLSHGALNDVTRRLVEVMQMDPTIREYVGVPVTFSFGAGRIRAIAEVGGKAFIPGSGFRLDEVARMLEAGEINALSAVPSMLRLVLAQPALFEAAGSVLRWIEIGSQYMPAAEKAALCELFPNARIVQHYGLTEASRSTFLVASEAQGEYLETVGEATGSVALRIDSDGIIWIRGDHTAMGQIIKGELRPLVDSEGWLRTSDLGRLDAGKLSYLGRSDDVANIAGIKVSADHFEQGLLRRLGTGVDYIAVAIGEDHLRGQRLIVAITPSGDRDLVERVTRAAAAEHGLGAADVRIADIPAIPRTATGKIQRGLLASMIDEPLSVGPEPVAGAEPNSPEAELAAIWREILGVSEIHPDDSFFDVGGDSLSAVTVALRAEQAGLSSDVLHRMFEGHSLREIAAGAAPDRSKLQTPSTRRAQLSNAINSTRGILVLMVIGAHWLPFLYDRMGDTGNALRHWLAPVFHIGTPGFAIIFGIGLVFFYRPLMVRSEDSFRRKLRSNTKLLAAGVLIQAAVLLLELLVVDGGLGPIYPERLFYSVLLFYLLMIPTAGIWLRLIYSGRSPAVNALIVAVCGALVWAFFGVTWPLGEGYGWVRLVQHMLVAPYAYPLLLSAVCVGASIGVWVAERHSDPRFAQRCGTIGALFLVGGAAVVALFTAGWWVVAQTPAAFPAYAGAVMLMLAAMTAVIERDHLRKPIRLLASIGLLAFPAFVGHGIVIPLVHVLDAQPIPYVVALAVPLAAFLIIAFLAVRKLYSMLFGASARRDGITAEEFGV